MSGYHRFDVAQLPGSPAHPCERRSVSEAADLATLAAAVYTLAPGEDLARSYHYHEHREELFYVLAGTLAVETPEGTFEVGSDEVFVVDPGRPIRPHNPETAEKPARVLGAGAPQHDPGKPYEPDGA